MAQQLSFAVLQASAHRNRFHMQKLIQHYQTENYSGDESELGNKLQDLLKVCVLFL